jgi:hypothetical protein
LFDVLLVMAPPSQELEPPTNPGRFNLSRKYSEYASGAAPSLPLFLIAAGMLYHQSTVEKLRRMQFDSGILKAVSERPDVIAGLQGRIEQYQLAAFKALQVGSAVRILQRDGGEGFPTFRASGTELPKPVRDGEASVHDIFNSAKRLGAWFAMDSIEILRRQLNIEF